MNTINSTNYTTNKQFYSRIKFLRKCVNSKNVSDLSLDKPSSFENLKRSLNLHIQKKQWKHRMLIVCKRMMLHLGLFTLIEKSIEKLNGYTFLLRLGSCYEGLNNNTFIEVDSKAECQLVNGPDNKGGVITFTKKYSFD